MKISTNYNEAEKRLFPNYKTDIFINYCHADNDEPLDDKQRGWVDALHENLEKRLRKLTGKDTKIWRDKAQMAGHDVITPTLKEELQKVALLIPILTPSYLTSDWCIPELIEFYKRAVMAGKLQINNKSRIFKVIKTPVDNEKHPDQLKDLPGYKFYDEYPNGMPREFTHISRHDGFEEFLRELETLAWDISRFVELCKATDIYPRTVYLAGTTSDLKKVREEIKHELEMHNYHVLPDKELPTEEPEFREAVRDYLNRSRLSIHLIGEEPGYIPEGDKMGIVNLQHSLALERQLSPDFFRVIWTPLGLKARAPVHQKFIDYLKKEPQVQENAELMLGNTNLPNLKTYLLDKLDSMQPRMEDPPPPPPPLPSVNGEDTTGHWEEAPIKKDPTRIYLMFDRKDLETARPLLHYLNQSYNVTWPVMDGKGKQVKQNSKANARNLAECDVAIIFYGNVRELWVREKLDELEQIMAVGRTKPRPLSALYIAGPTNDAKEIYETNLGYQVIKNYAEFSPESLASLLDEIKKRFSRSVSKGIAR